jgi:hypothetical protein
VSGIWILVLARARRRPGRWLLPALGITLAVAYAGAVGVQTQVAGSQAARAVLAATAPLDRAVRISWEGPVTPTARARALDALHTLGLAPGTEVTLLNPVRLNGVIVRPAGIAPPARWSSPAPASSCRASDCPVLLAGGQLSASVLATEGARLTVAGHTRVNSSVPLGFVPEAGAPGEFPLLITGDARGLDALAGLSGVYRSHSWVSLLAAAGLQSWQLADVQHRLAQVQAGLLAESPQFTLSAPFGALNSARAAAAAVPHRLLVAGGGALTALVLFIVLSAASLRRDQEQELTRLELAGARPAHGWLFVVLEAAWLSGLAAACGALLALIAGALLASTAHVPAAGALTHSLLTPAGALGLVGGWLGATALVTVLVLLPGRGVADAAALAAAAALVAAVAAGHDNGSFALALAPLGCLAAGVLVYRFAGWLAGAGERLLRGGPVLARLALIGLARAPRAPALAIAFVALSTGLGGFALVYRATLARSAADQADEQVPLDAIVASSPAFVRPLDVASLARWHALTGATVVPVRRTQASFVSGGASVTVPALGIPAGALTSLRGWPAAGASAPPRALARRLMPAGRAPAPAAALPTGTRALSLGVSSRALDVSVSAALRAPDGRVSTVDLGVARAGTRTLRARLPAGRWVLAALELNEPTGLQITNDHQNGENAAPATQVSAAVMLGPLRALGRAGRLLATTPIGGWRAVGSARVLAPGSAAVRIAVSESGLTALVRPPALSDEQPVPVLVDRATAAAAARGRRLGLEVDGLPVSARVVGVLTRFPSVAPDSAGFVIADEATLAAALEAQMPGQGAPDELWLSTPRLATVRAALATGALASLTTTFRSDLERGLRQAPVARAVMLTLSAAAGLAAGLAVLGLLVVLVGTLRDRELEDDLYAQGLGPRALRLEMRLRLCAAAAIGVGCGLLVALALARLAVAVVQAAGAVTAPDPPLAAVAPVPLLLGWSLGALVALIAAGWLVTARLPRRFTS